MPAISFAPVSLCVLLIAVVTACIFSLSASTRQTLVAVFWQAAALVGAIKLLRWAWWLLKCCNQALHACVIASALQRYGPGHAVITGAANGIGRQWAIRLAEKGFGLVLVDMDEAGLQATKEMVQKNGAVAVRTVAFDFCKSDDCVAMEQLVDKITLGLDVCILVNNVGMMRASPVFTDTHLSDHVNVCKVNMLPALVLTQLLFTKVFSKREKRAAVINMGSFSGLTPFAGNAVYSASKSFVQILSGCMSKELEGCVDVLCLSPLGVGTDLIKIPADELTVLTAEQVVDASLPYLGVVRYTYGHWLHAAQATAMMLVGDELRLSLCHFLQKMSLHKMKQ